MIAEIVKRVVKWNKKIKQIKSCKLKAATLLYFFFYLINTGFFCGFP